MFDHGDDGRHDTREPWVELVPCHHRCEPHDPDPPRPTSALHGRHWPELVNEHPRSDLLGLLEVGASLGSLILGYDLQENVTGLGPVVAAHHAANNGNGATPSVDIPIDFIATRGGVGIGGGVHHDVLVQNQLLPVPATFYPSGDLQTITSRHTQLFDADDLARVTLLGYVQGMADPLLAYEVDLTSSTPSWQQTSGAGVLDLRSVSATSMGRTWTIDWALEANWSTDDIERITWHAQGFQSDGAGFGPAIDTSGGVNGVMRSRMTSKSIDGPYVMQPVISCRMWVRPPIRSGPRLEVRLTSRVRFDSKGPSISVRCRTMPPSQ